MPESLKQLEEKWRAQGLKMAPTTIPHASNPFQNYGSALRTCADELAAFRKEWLGLLNTADVEPETDEGKMYEQWVREKLLGEEGRREDA